MKRAISFLIVLCMVVSMIPAVFAAEKPASKSQSATADWEYVSYGSGVALTAYNGTATDVYVPSQVDGETVVKLGDGLFKDNDALNSVTLGAGILEIGAQAFYDCDNLVCIVTNEELTTIGAEAFYSCDVFNSIVLQDSVTDIGENVFGDAASLTVYCNSSSTAYDYCVQNGHNVILLDPNAQAQIVNYDKMVYHLSNGSATLMGPINQTTDVDSSQIVIPSHVNGVPVTKINDAAFKHKSFRRGMYNTQWSIVLPETINNIGPSAFEYTPLYMIRLPAGVTQIKDRTFSCSDMRDFQVDGTITYIGDYAFYGTELSDLPDISNVTYIGSYAFTQTALQTVTLPENIDMGYNVFSGCGQLETVYIPESVSQIPNNCFQDCISLRTVYLSQYTSFTTYEFQGCPLLVLCFTDSSGWGYYSMGMVDEAIPYYSLNDGWEPTFVEENGILYYIDPEQAMVMYASSDLDGHIDIPGEICGYPVTRINQSAFRSCTELDSVYLPDSIQWIGLSAFEGCYDLESINIPMGVRRIPAFCFKDTYTLTSIELASSVEEIGYYAFAYTGDLQIPSLDNVQNIEYYAFSYSDITSFEYPLYTNLEDGVFADCDKLVNLTIPEGVTTIPRQTFSSCDSLEEVEIPKSVTSMEGDCLSGLNLILGVYSGSCAETYALQNNIPFYNVETGERIEVVDVNGIRYFVFADHAELACVADSSWSSVIPAEINGLPVTKIRKEAFKEVYMSKITLPDTIEEIGENAFYWTYLKSVQLPSNLKEISRGAFFWTSLTSIKLPESVTRIGTSAFTYSNLRSVPSLENVTYVGDFAFAHNSISGTITIPAHTYFDTRCFMDNDVTKVIFEDGVTRIPGQMFADCKSLATVFIPSSVTEIASNAFSGCPKAVLHVFHGSYALQYAIENDLEYIVLYGDGNPEVVYGSAITGMVSYLDGTAANGATVEILYDDGTVKEAVTADETGAYAFTYAEVGRYTIRVTDSNGNTASTQVSVKRMNAFDVFLAGDTNLTLKKGWTVSGTVSNGAATVTITDEKGNVLDSVETSDGSFTFSNVPNGTYVIKAETENGTVTREITVFDGHVTDVALSVVSEHVTVWGYVEVEDRELDHHRRNWVQVSIYNAEGTVVAQTKSDKDGMYRFEKLPISQYSIVAETAEMRPDKHHHYDRSHTLTGYSYVDASAAGEYQADTIVLYEENDSLATISGKVTAQGEHQACQVILRNVFRHEVAQQTTGKNGKYSFTNIRDGLYFVIAVTESEGMGYTVVAVRNGKVHGETDITIYKVDKIKDREDRFHKDFNDCHDRDSAMKHKDRIVEEKRFYDGLSEKEKKQLSKKYVEHLNRMCEWIAECEYVTDEGVSVEQGGLVVSGDELENEDAVTFEISVEKTDAWTANTEGVQEDKDFIYHDMHDKAGHGDIKQYYEISMTKTVDGQTKQITSVTKDTEATGKFRITMEIPEEYRGHKHYTMLHVHNGETVTLADLDDDPNTITFEVDGFSTFALTGTDEILIPVTHAQVWQNAELYGNYISLEDAVNGCELAGQYVKLIEDTETSLSLGQDLYIDLNGYTLTGTIITNGYKIYGIDSTTNDYSCENMGYFNCIDENGKAVIPEKHLADAGYMRYMSIETDNGYTFHRFYLGITYISLKPTVTGFGYKAEFYGDEMVQSQIASVGYRLWVIEGHVVGRSMDGFRNSLTLRLKNFDVTNYGETPVNACVAMVLTDGTVIQSGVQSHTLRSVVESVNTNYANFTETQLSAVKAMIQVNPTMQTWKVENIYQEETQ